jgi:hypothetical protein
LARTSPSSTLPTLKLDVSSEGSSNACAVLHRSGAAISFKDGQSSFIINQGWPIVLNILLAVRLIIAVCCNNLTVWHGVVPCSVWPKLRVQPFHELGRNCLEATLTHQQQRRRMSKLLLQHHSVMLHVTKPETLEHFKLK